MPSNFYLQKAGESGVFAVGLLARQVAAAHAATTLATGVVRAIEARNTSSDAVPDRLNLLVRLYQSRVRSCALVLPIVQQDAQALPRPVQTRFHGTYRPPQSLRNVSLRKVGTIT